MISYFFRSFLVFAVHVSKNRTTSCSFSCSILYPLNITPTLLAFSHYIFISLFAIINENYELQLENRIRTRNSALQTALFQYFYFNKNSSVSLENRFPTVIQTKDENACLFRIPIEFATERCCRKEQNLQRGEFEEVKKYSCGF